MKRTELREIYDTLLDTGELYEVMPRATGIWEKDVTSFQIIQEGMDNAIHDLEVEHRALYDFEEEDEEEDPFFDDEYF